MTLAIKQLSTPQPAIDSGELLRGVASSRNSGWHEIVAAVSSYTSTVPSGSQSSQRSLEHLTGLLKLQMDVTRYQLRVEVVSKVAESAVTSLRKLQQSQ